MRIRKEYGDYLNDILVAMEKIENFVEGMTYDVFINNEPMIWAVERGIEIIGEATKRIPNSIRNKYPEIPWKDMAGMRDKLSHDYDEVDLELVWKVIKQEIPSLKVMLSDMIAELKDDR
jgi:uncharacterized protein with HEPN domain